MKAMILAAGRGQRMRPLTDHRPKPLLEAGGLSLIGWHLRALARAGLREVVINHAHLGHMIEAALGDGAAYGVQIRYSPEGEALETAGGIAKALPLLGAEPFLVINGDIHTSYDPARAFTIVQQMQAARLQAWCVLITNPEHNPSGDFGLQGGRLCNSGPQRYTFSGIGVYEPSLFRSIEPGTKAQLAPLLRGACERSTAGGELFAGHWADIGTPGRLAQLDAQLRENGRSQGQ